MTFNSFVLILSFELAAAWNREWTLDEVKTMDHKCAFDSWAFAFNRSYNSVEEELHKFHIWKDNLHVIASTNSKNLSYKFGLNQFSDMTPLEFRSYIGLSDDNSCQIPDANRTTNVDETRTVGSTPSAIDWCVNTL